MIQGCGSGNRSGSSEADLRTEIKGALKDDKGIDEEEWRGLVEMVMDDDQLSQKYQGKETLLADIDKIAKEMSESRRNPISYPPDVQATIDFSVTRIDPTPQGTTQEPSQEYNIYIENSGSMYGYLNGNTQFKDAFMALCSRIKRSDEEMSFYFVNDEIHPVQGELQNFMYYLDPKNKQELRKKGNVSTSNLVSIFELVIDSLMSNGTPAILSSDFIFSLQTKNAKLAEQKYSITSLIVEKNLRKEGYGFLIIKGISMFKGSYYNFEKPLESIPIEMNRPYYTWVIAKNDKLIDFANSYDIESLKGYENHFVIYDELGKGIPYFSILRDTEVKGGFDTPERDPELIHHITDIEYSRRGEKEFQFAVALDLSRIPAKDEYLTNTEFYAIASDRGDNFNIERIVPIGQIDVKSKDKRKFVGSATHVVIISTPKMSTGSQELRIALEKHMPKWVEESSTDDDTDIGKKDSTRDTSGKTFGFDYLVEGVVDAYSPVKKGANNYFEISLILER